MISIFIPAYNEEKYISKAANTILDIAKNNSVLVELIIANDGSTDNTISIINDLSIKNTNVSIINNEINIGIGASFKKFLKIAKYNKIMIAPGDDDANLELIEKLFQNFNKADLITSFYMNREARGKIRVLISDIYHLIYLVFFGYTNIYLNGPTIYPSNLLRSFKIRSNRFSIVTELNIKCMRSKIYFYEVPGMMNTGSAGSTAISFKNLFEVIKVFFLLIFEVHFKEKKRFKNKATRILN